MALCEPGATLADRAKICVLVLAGAALAELWPYYSVWGVVLGSDGVESQSWVDNALAQTTVAASVWTNRFYDPAQVALALGPALLGVPCIAYLAYRGANLFIVFGFFIFVLFFFFFGFCFLNFCRLFISSLSPSLSEDIARQMKNYQ